MTILLVQNLKPTDNEEVVRSVFQNYGSLREVNMVPNNDTVYNATVTFNEPDDAEDAISGADGYDGWRVGYNPVNPTSIKAPFQLTNNYKGSSSSYSIAELIEFVTANKTVPPKTTAVPTSESKPTFPDHVRVYEPYMNTVTFGSVGNGSTGFEAARTASELELRNTDAPSSAIALKWAGPRPGYQDININAPSSSVPLEWAEARPDVDKKIQPSEDNGFYAF